MHFVKLSWIKIYLSVYVVTCIVLLHRSLLHSVWLLITVSSEIYIWYDASWAGILFMYIVSSDWLCRSWRWQTGDQFYTKRWWTSHALYRVWFCWHWRSCIGHVQHWYSMCVFLFTAVVVISEKMLFCEIIVCVYLFRVNHAI